MNSGVDIMVEMAKKDWDTNRARMIQQCAVVALRVVGLDLAPSTPTRELMSGTNEVGWFIDFPRSPYGVSFVSPGTVNNEGWYVREIARQLQKQLHNQAQDSCSV